jgi:hypothetical protein
MNSGSQGRSLELQFQSKGLLDVRLRSLNSPENLLTFYHFSEISVSW